MSNSSTPPAPVPLENDPAWLDRVRQFPKARITRFADFNNRYAGKTCCVVGRGPTEFPYAELAGLQEPVFFINDSVSVAGDARGDTFFFAHDARMLVWLDGRFKGTAVLPFDGKLFLKQPEAVLSHAGGLAFYRWKKRAGEELLRMGRDELAAAEELFTHCGTIHSLLHFVWFCGFKRVVFIGCDGINDPELLSEAYDAPGGYDARLPNLSRTRPWWQYDAIRENQDRLCARLGLETVYRGTPRPAGFAAIKKFILFNPRREKL
jgi:hypothetical protein